jgi:subtilase family serine protease
MAPDANVGLVVSASTNTTDGVDLSELYIIDNNMAPIMTESFGTCEQNVTAAQASMDAALTEQAAAQGITFMVSSGDSGSATCDRPTSAAETQGVSVSFPASSRIPSPWVARCSTRAGKTANTGVRPITMSI